MITTNKVLHSYINGNYTVTLYEDGTKVRDYEDAASLVPVYPESIDVKITNYCDLNCKFCHEESTVEGLHGDLSLLLTLTEGCPAGVELAIGGGNALAHPDIMEVFPKLAARGIILNVTVNQEHLLDATYMGMLLELIQKDVIRGVGISVTDNVERVAAQLSLLQSHTNNVVYHVIAGVNTVEVLAKLEQISSTYKVLVLGYKQHGRGNKFYQLREKSVVDNLCRWYQFLPRYIGKNNIISFDNLAIKQLNVRRLFSNREWQKFYMGDDGTHTFYIDLIEQKFANSSTTEVQHSLLSSNIEMFQQIRTQYAS